MDTPSPPQLTSRGGDEISSKNENRQAGSKGEMTTRADTDTALLLKSILEELKVIKEHVRIGQQQQHQQGSVLPGGGFGDREEASGGNGNEETEREEEGPSESLSIAARRGAVLREALRRYRTNAVPQWSTFYGTHVSLEVSASSEISASPPPAPGPNGFSFGPSHGDDFKFDHEEKHQSVRVQEKEVESEADSRAAWTSLVGECWRIPHDNRVSLCFAGAGGGAGSPPSMGEPHGGGGRMGVGSEKLAVLARVRNFLFHYHDDKSTGGGRGNYALPPPPRGKYVNIWDWFDEGISAYWFPQKSRLDLGADAQRRAKIEAALAEPGTDSGESVKDVMARVPPLVAPWRRIMCVSLHPPVVLLGTQTDR